MAPPSNFSPETLAHLKQLTQEKKSRDVQSSKKINFAYLLVTAISGYLLYAKSSSKNNHIIKFVICNLYPLIIVQSQIFGGNYNLAKTNKIVVFLSLIANVITFIWQNFYFWAGCLVIFLLIGIFNIIQIVRNIKNKGIIPGMSSNPASINAYSHLTNNNQTNAPSLMDSFSQTVNPLQKIQQQTQQAKAKKSINEGDQVVYKSTNGMKIPENMSKGMRAALNMKDENGNSIDDDEPLSKRQLKLKKKFEKMQKMNSNKGGSRS
ncbi:hypothetical protein QEN19_003831 [Hanseniaspora menglaensis]